MGCLCYLGTVALVRLPTGRESFFFSSSAAAPPATATRPAVAQTCLLVYAVFCLKWVCQRVAPHELWHYPDSCGGSMNAQVSSGSPADRGSERRKKASTGVTSEPGMSVTLWLFDSTPRYIWVEKSGGAN